MAVQQPGIKTVAVKSEAQQAVLALHRMRQQLVKFRTHSDPRAVSFCLCSTPFGDIDECTRHGAVPPVPIICETTSLMRLV